MSAILAPLVELLRSPDSVPSSRWNPLLESIAKSQDKAVAAALLSLFEEPTGGERWLKRLGHSDVSRMEPAERLLFVQIPDDAVDEAIDKGLAGKNAPLVLDALVRTDVAWTHDNLIKLLDADASRFAAAWILAEADTDEEIDALNAWLAKAEVAEDAFEVLRALALRGAENWFDRTVQWVEELDENDADEARMARKMTGLLAVMHPAEYARRAFLEELGTDWLNESESVADFLVNHAITDWTDTLSTLGLSGEWEGFAIAAKFAVCASQSTLHEPPNEEDAEALMALHNLAAADPSALNQAVAGDPRFAMALCLGEDEEEVARLVQATIHETMRGADFPTPGITGLPLSPSAKEWLSDEAAQEIFQTLGSKQELDPEETFVLVRTLSDLRLWVRAHEDSARLKQALLVSQTLVQHPVPSVAFAARRLQATVAPKSGKLTSGEPQDVLVHATHDKGPETLAALAKLANDESITGLVALEHLVDFEEITAIRELVLLWAHGPLSRASYYRDILTDVILGTEEYEEGEEDEA